MIFRPYEIYIAFRFLIKGKFQTLLLFSGIALGVAVQFFLNSLIGGLQLSLIERTVGTSPHILILPREAVPTQIMAEPGQIFDSRKAPVISDKEILQWEQYIEWLNKQPGLKAVCPVASGQGSIERNGPKLAVSIKGIDPLQGSIIYKFDKNLVSGQILLSGESVVIGSSLADKFQLEPGDRLFIQNDRGSSNFFTVSGIVDLGSTTANSVIFMSLERGQSFLAMTGINLIEVQIKDVFQAEKLASLWQQEFIRVKVESWQERNRELLTALRSQRSSSNLIQFFVLLAISLGIASVLSISAVQKSKQLGILKAIGVDNRGAARIFLIQGLTLGFFGSLAGIIIGYILSLFFIKVFGTGTFNLQLEVTNFIIPAILAMVISALASLSPARKAARLSPIEVIRYG
ncbi:MAG: ABC transporter permease [Candidatus Aminicenantes bacterium]|nr:ABC transporter permease [Candidatus Aminicenantes bacterium]